MSESTTKKINLNIKDLSFKSEAIVVDLIRFIAERLPKVEITRNGMDVEIKLPQSLSKRAIKLRIKKFLYQKSLDSDFRPISDNTKDGYILKEKKGFQMSYY